MRIIDKCIIGMHIIDMHTCIEYAFIIYICASYVDIHITYIYVHHT